MGLTHADLMHSFEEEQREALNRFAERWSHLPHAELVGHLAKLSFSVVEGARLHRDDANNKMLGYMVQQAAFIDFLRDTGIHSSIDREPFEHARAEDLNPVTKRNPGGLRMPRSRQGHYVSSDQGMIKIYVWAAVNILRQKDVAPSNAWEQVAKALAAPINALPTKLIKAQSRKARAQPEETAALSTAAKRVKSICAKIDSVKQRKDFPPDGVEACFIEHFLTRLGNKREGGPDQTAELEKWYDEIVQDAHRHFHRIE